MSTKAATIPAPPRPITAAARARSWNEAPVRVWMILSFLVAMVLVYLLASRIIEGMRDRRLIRDGTPVKAQVVGVDGRNIDVGRNQQFNRDVSRKIRVTFTTPQGLLQTIEEDLPPKVGGRVTIGEMIEIRVDPNDSAVATTRSEPRPWSIELSVVFMLVPVLLFTLIVLLMKRAGILKVWRDGQEMVAVAVDSKQSSIAPRSRVLRFTLRDSDDTRVFNMLYPASAGAPGKDDELLVIAPPARPDRAIAAVLYQP